MKSSYNIYMIHQELLEKITNERNEKPHSSLLGGCTWSLPQSLGIDEALSMSDL